MKTNPTQKRVNPIPMLTTLTKIFNLDLQKLVLTNRSLTTLAIAVAKPSVVNEIASRLPVVVKSEKRKPKRLLRLLAHTFPIDTVIHRWLGLV